MEDRLYRVVTAERLREVLSYEPLTGEFHWKVRTGWRVRVGDLAGCLQKVDQGGGYRVISVDGRMYKAARLAYLYMTGDWPESEIDHINRVRDDDRWENLRPLGSAANKENTRRSTRNQSGYRDVSLHRKTGTWRVRVVKNGVEHLGGYHHNIADAVASRDALRSSLGLIPAIDSQQAAPETIDNSEYAYQRGRCGRCGSKGRKLNWMLFDQIGSVLGVQCEICAEKYPWPPEQPKHVFLDARMHWESDIQFAELDLHLRRVELSEQTTKIGRSQAVAEVRKAERELERVVAGLVKELTGRDLPIRLAERPVVASEAA